MDLKTWLEAERGRKATLAQYLSSLDPSKTVSGAFIWQLSLEPGHAHHKPVPVERAAAIEEFTEKAVMRWDMRPNDWWRIWPELKDRKGAPDVPAVAERT